MTDKKLTVAVDIDGVIYDIIGHIINKFKPHLGRLRPCNWDCWTELETTKGGFFKMYSECWVEAATNPDIGSKYTDPYADNLFTFLRRNKHIRTSIITKRSKADIKYTIQYLENMDFHFDTFTVITDVQDKTKEHCDVIIEDNPKNMTPNKICILVNQAWNKGAGNKYWIRTDGLKPIPDLLRSSLPLYQTLLRPRVPS